MYNKFLSSHVLTCTIVLNVLAKITAHSTSFDDGLLFQIGWPGSIEKAASDGLLQRYRDDQLKPDEAIILSSAKDERYVCSLPLPSEDKIKNPVKYAGPSPRELIHQLHAKNRCTYRMETYWTYELCHGKALMQYHEEKDSPQRRAFRQQYYLGQYMPEVVADELDTYDENDPPSRKIEDQRLPYFPVRYVQGTHCDITGNPRNVTIMYVCDPDGKNQIFSIDEVQSCEYEVIILTPNLCLHPRFRSQEPRQCSLECYAVDRAPIRPSAMAVWERERDWETTIAHNEIILPKLPVDDGSRSSSPDARTDAENGFQPPPIVPPSDSSVVNSFLSGEYCLYGGAGWWKHEYCYGKHVVQYHEQEDGNRVEIMLGRWDQYAHKKWIEDKPHKRPLKIDDSVRQVTHFHVDGDFCDVTGRPRTVEVRLRCKESSRSPNAITLYLLEPKSCEYILGVESQIFCAFMQTVDDNGLFTNV